MRSRGYGSNRCCCAGAYLHSIPKHYPARSRLRPYEATGRKKKQCGREPDRCEPFLISMLYISQLMYIYTSYIYIHHIYIYNTIIYVYTRTLRLCLFHSHLPLYISALSYLHFFALGVHFSTDPTFVLLPEVLISFANQTFHLLSRNASTKHT